MMGNPVSKGAEEAVMRHRIRGIVLVALGVLAGRALGQGEGYTIRFKDPAVGETVRVEKDETSAEQTRLTGPMGIVFDRGFGGGEVSVFRETVLVRPPNGAPTRLRRTYEKAQVRNGPRMRTLVYDGKTVLIERKKDRYTFWLEGRGELTAAEAKQLDKEFNTSDERFGLRNLLPPGPVRPGEYPWPVDVRPLMRDLARTGKIIPDPLRSKGTGRMKRVFRDEDGHLCAELHIQLEFALAAMNLSGQKLLLGPASRAVSDMVLELCIDGGAVYLTHKDTMRIDSAAGYRLPDGAAAVLTMTVETNATGGRREEPGAR
jgi:hypothetical protein